MWARDDAKLDRVRSLMEDEGLDALVVRAPDNVLYLTNFWSMKGYDACVFPREGEPVLICLEASAEDASRTAWTGDVRHVRGYDEGDARPVLSRTLDAAVDAARGYGRVGLELSLGTQASDRMVGEPTTYTKAFFDAFEGAEDATPLLNACRAIKTEQELERMRLANEIADAALAHVHERLRPGMKDAELDGRYVELLELLLAIYGEAVEFCRDGASLAELDRLIRARIAEGGYPGQPSHPVAHGVGARAHEPPYAHQADERQMAAGMVLAIEPGIYWEGGGGLRLEDDYVVTSDGAPKLSSWPDDFR